MPEATKATVALPAPTSWRAVCPVHPCADVFPLLSEPELESLAKDIEANGLRQPITFWKESARGQIFLLDGRNRLDALTRLNRDVAKALREFMPSLANSNGTTSGGDVRLGVSFDLVQTSDPAAYVISINIKRRHLTKEQQAELIVKTIEAANATDRTKSVRSVNRDANGRVKGSTKDPVFDQAVKEAAKHGISKSTVKNARAKVKGKSPAPKKPKRQKLPLEQTIDSRPTTPTSVSATPPKNEATPLVAQKPDLDEQITHDLATIEREIRRAWASYRAGQPHLQFYSRLSNLFDALRREWGFEPAGVMVIGGRRKSK